MEPSRFIRSGIAASAIGHLSILAMVLVFAEVHPFGTVTAEPIAVDIVSRDEAAKVPEKVEPPVVPPETSLPDPSVPAKAALPEPPAPPPAPPQAATPQPTASPTAKRPTPPAPRPSRQAAAAPPQPAPAPPAPAVTPVQPDISVKYHLALGFPEKAFGGGGDGYDGPAYKSAAVEAALAGAFKDHLKTCATLPKSVGPSDSVKIVLRVFMMPDGKLATDPVLIEASASEKGPLLMQSAISALQACQPYSMLPADKYGEWKTLDLSFTPQDLSGE